MPDSWTAFGPELPLALARDGLRPLHAQLEDALRSAIREGRLAPGARLPSTRTLATDLGLSRGLVVEVYSQLIAEGCLAARSGSATRVAPSSALSRYSVDAPALEDRKIRWDFRPALPDLALFPRSAWGRAQRHALQCISDRALGYGNPRGTATLRAELAAYLRRVRSVQADPERIVICSGFTQALALICRVLAPRGAFAVEDPGAPAAWSRIMAAGSERLPVPVDEQGLSVEALVATEARTVLTTPAHQFPTGVALSPERRNALLAWAAAGGLVVEDDYDAEFRYDREPVGALQGLAPDRVLYVGSASKTLAPALRLGWIVLPADLVDGITEAKRIDDLGCPALEQDAFAHMLATGAHDRHLRRARASYRAKRDALVAALDRDAPQLRVQGIAAGLQALVTLPRQLDESSVVQAARGRSVGVYPLGAYRLRSSPEAPGLVLGYATLSQPAITAGVARLAEALPPAGASV